jgi:hypothetical protein
MMHVPTYQRLVVFGCSLTKDNFIDTWADLLSNKLGIPLFNHAERGAGYDYIVQKILSVQFTKNDLVVIMWPSADRYDVYVNSATPHLQDDVNHASWLDGKMPQFVDYQGNYNQQHGWYINGAVPRGYKHHYYKYFYNQTTHVNKAWSTIVLVQNYLDNIGINYLMCSSYPLKKLIQYHDDGVTDFNHDLYDKINFAKFVRDSDINGFIDLVKQQGFDFFNPQYPTSDGHRWYIENYIQPELPE